MMNLISENFMEKLSQEDCDILIGYMSGIESYRKTFRNSLLFYFQSVDVLLDYLSEMMAEKEDLVCETARIVLETPKPEFTLNKEQEQWMETASINDLKRVDHKLDRDLKLIYSKAYKKNYTL